VTNVESDFRPRQGGQPMTTHSSRPEMTPCKLGTVGKMLGLVELTSGDHVTLTFRWGKLARGALSGTVGCHINSIQAEPQVLGHGLT